MQSYENWDRMFRQSVGATDVPANPLTRQAAAPREVPLMAEGQQNLILLRVKKLVSTERLDRARTQLNLNDSAITSAIFGMNDPRQLPLVHFYMISRDAELFINRQKNPLRFRKDITTISDRASEYLSREGIKAKISVSLFADPEYDDWIEPKIRIEVPKDELAKTYGIYNGLLSYCLQGIRRRTMKQLFVTIESA